MSNPSKPEDRDRLKMAISQLTGPLRFVTVPFGTPPAPVSPRVGISSIFKRSPKSKTTLIIGLGNVSDEYARTRHNIGFLVLDALAEKLGTSFSLKKKLKAEIAEASTQDGKRTLIKPTTYMNLSGEAAAAVIAWQKPDQTIVVYDDADLPFGDIRVKEKGGSAGHNGIKSLIQHLGTDAFTRVRIGIGRPDNPNIPLEDWVLKKWSQEEEQHLPDMIEKACSTIQQINSSS